MIKMDAFQAGDVYLDYPSEDVKFRYEKESNKVFRRFYGQPEKEILPSSELYNEAISAGTQITKEKYYED